MPSSPSRTLLTSRNPRQQTHLFLHHVLRFHLNRSPEPREAVLFASHYSKLIYFPHALEMLLHEVLEDEADSTAPPFPSPSPSTGAQPGMLARVIDFLDHFDECLQVVVNCARKTEVTRWELLFRVAGKPRELFEVSRASWARPLQSSR